MPDLKAEVTSHDHTAGPASASVTLVEYGDYECPDCGEAYPIIKRMQQRFGDRLRFVFRNFPLSQHPHAEAAAEAAEFAAGKDKFWPMHDAIYEHQNELSLQTLEKLAQNAGLDPSDMHTVLGAHALRPRVQADVHSGKESGVHSTPTFFLNSTLFLDSYNYDSLVETVQNTLSNGG